MRKSILFSVIFFVFWYAVPAQNKTADSLNQLLQSAKEDTSRVELMSRIASAYLFSKPDSTLSIAEDALALSRKIKMKSGEARTLNLIGHVFRNTGNYPKALENYLLSLRIAEELHDGSIARSFGNLANVYFDEGDMERSIDYSRKAISIQRDLRDSIGLVLNFVNLGDTYEKTGQLDSALVYTRLAYIITIERKNTYARDVLLNNLGNIFLKLGQPDSAMYFYKSSIPYARENINDESLCETNLGIAKIFLLRRQPDSCLWYAKVSHLMAKNDGFIDRLLSSSTFLAGYYKSVGNTDSAFEYLSATIAAKDSLFSQQKANQVQSMTYDETIRRRQLEEARQQGQAELKQDALIGGLAALLIVAFLLVRNNRQRKKAHTVLQKQKEEIDNKAKELSAQKDRLQRSYDNVEKLADIGRKITASLSVEKIIGTVYNNVNTLMDAAVFGIGIYNETQKRIEFPSTYENGEALPFYANYTDDRNRFGPVCFTSGKEIIIGNLDEEYKDHIQEVLTPHEGGQPISIIFLPLTVKEKKLGVITVQSFKENAYSDYHLFMLRNIATYTAIAIENAESFESLNEAMSTLKATQSQLVQSEKMASLGELTAGIAHEIQNPLNFVNNFSEVNTELIEEFQETRRKKPGASDEKLENEILNDIKENEKKINYHGRRADAIVKSMLQHTRSSTGLKEPTDINDLADEYLRLAYHGFRAKDNSANTTINTEFDQSIGKINIMPQEIGRVLLNLYNNAFYAAGEKKKLHPENYEPAVSLSTKKSGNQVFITVKDNGNGIPQPVVDKIFQPFFTTKPTGQGTGLGLSLSYDIVKAHGGEIKVNTKEGEYTEFVILLPLFS
jgi:signal transduction histidine kinase/Tfp pilus assembly protein PilF